MITKMSKYFFLKIGHCLALIIALICLASCSITKNLAEGERLYTGYTVDYKKQPHTPVGNIAVEEINAALDKTPSTKMFGIIPIPFGLWVYNDFVKYEKGFGKWIFNRFATKPIYISTVNPDIRQKIAVNLLRDYGYFNGTAESKVIVNPKDSLKASISYTIDMKNPYFIDTVEYKGFDPVPTKIIERTKRFSLLKPGQQFNVVTLDNERTRLSTSFRNLGYYYFQPDYITYLADTTLVRGGHVALRVQPTPGIPEIAQKQFYVGNVLVYIMGKDGQVPNDSMQYKGMSIHYYDKLQVRPNMIYRWINYQAYVKNDSLRKLQSRRLYSQYRQQRIQEKIAQTGIFSFMDLQYTPKDTTATCDTLNVVLQATLGKPLDAEFGINAVLKSTDQMGPSASLSITKNNVFGGGESWNVTLKGSYEWQTGGSRGEDAKSMNSWDMGISTSLTFPRVFFPSFGGQEYDFPATTTFKIYVEQLNRAKYYRQLAFGGNATYDFQPTKVSKYSFTPFKLTFNVLQRQTEEFKQIAETNPALYVSLENQFIPAIGFTYTYDNSSLKNIKNPSWWQSSVTSAGNIFSCIYAAFGEPFDKKNKGLLGTPFAQFLKVTTDYHYLWNLPGKTSLAMRVAGGVLWAYGNKDVAPYTEQFYLGGANSLRAFSVRGLGPGGTKPHTGKYGYLDQTGNIRMEANIEYRFPIYGDIYGAVFLDAGNVWLMRSDPVKPEGQLRLKTMPKQIALGTGIGLRYDLDILVFRLDWGIPIHDPWETGKKGYYNIEGKFMKQTVLNFAIGYPF